MAVQYLFPCPDCAQDVTVPAADFTVITSPVSTVARYLCPGCAGWRVADVSPNVLRILEAHQAPLQRVPQPPDDQPAGWEPMGEDEVLATLTAMHRDLQTRR